MRQWYEEVFSNYAEQYDKQEFVRGTSGEVDFIVKELKYDRSSRVLDIGCGTGRHSIELARRGYATTGVDLSGSMLAMARLKAQEAGVQVTFIQADARSLQFRDDFDLVMMLCEGAFPLMESDEMNYMILQSAASALRDDGKLILTTLNGLFPLFHSVKDFINGNKTGGSAPTNSFDLLTFRDFSTFDFMDDNGNSKSVQCNERYYVPSEITWLLKSLGFKAVQIFGCKLGAFSREDPLSTQDFEMLVVAQK
jgi:2-polyprenyl-3-methyl-5-hydroxy-6-metoxy-1,4-benzoquinol methylase